MWNGIGRGGAGLASRWSQQDGEDSGYENAIEGSGSANRGNGRTEALDLV
jgi:hypothetical protein